MPSHLVADGTLGVDTEEHSFRIDVGLEDELPDPSTENDSKNEIRIVRHEDQHQESRQSRGGSVEQGSNSPRPCRHFGNSHPGGSGQQQRLLTRALGTWNMLDTPVTQHLRRNSLLHLDLQNSQVLKEQAQQENGDKRADELGHVADVPTPEDDAGALDLRVPEHVHGAPVGYGSAVHAVIVAHCRRRGMVVGV